jgi:predicted lipoprotein with Yx(FWY)xxD motif
MVVAGTLAASTGLATAAATHSKAPSPVVTISAGSTAAGQVLELGSGPYAGAALYYLTADQAPTSYSCTPTVVHVGPHTISCTEEWPPILTSGTPTAGPGVNASLLGTVWRSDLNATQVTFAGHPLYAFNPTPGNISGDGFDEATIPPWHGNWYLLNASTGLAAPRWEKLGFVTLGNGRTVLGATMGTLLGTLLFPVYTNSADTRTSVSCTGACATEFPPVLSDGTVYHVAGSGIYDQSLGIILRPDGTRQVTFDGLPLYVYSNEAVNISTGAPVFAGNGNLVAAPSGGGIFHLSQG